MTRRPYGRACRNATRYPRNVGVTRREFGVGFGAFSLPGFWTEPRELTRARRVSPDLEKELARRGVAQALVYLEPPGAPQLTGDLDSCFVKDERLVAACPRYFPLLG